MVVIVGWLERQFHLQERGTTISQELRAGTTTFLTLSYLLLVNPNLMVQAGVTYENALIATALSASISCFIVGFGGNLPFGCAPGLGLSAYLTFGLVQADLCTLPEALSVCWWSGIFVIILSVFGISDLLLKIVPNAIKLGIVIGMGMLIAVIGMVSVQLIVANPKTLVTLGDITNNPSLQLCMMGTLLIATLMYHNIPGATLIGISILTIIDWYMNNTWPTSIIEIPSYTNHHYWTPLIIFNLDKFHVLYSALGAFVFICIFDVSGVMYGLATLAGIVQQQEVGVSGGSSSSSHTIPGSLWAFLASGFGTLIAAYIGSTPIIVGVECAAGIKDGGRTGLTAVIVGLYFLFSLFLSPLFSAIPDAATAPVLILVGVLMMGESAKVSWDKIDDATPAFLTTLLMPFTYSITNGMVFGLLASLGFYVTTGKVFQDTYSMYKTFMQSPTTLQDDHNRDEERIPLVSRSIITETNNYDTTTPSTQVNIQPTAVVVESPVGKTRTTKVLVLVSNQSFHREVVAYQERVISILESKKIPFSILDGADPANKDRRNALFELGIRAKYPQIFLVHEHNNNLTTFWGDWERFHEANDDGILESMLT